MRGEDPSVPGAEMIRVLFVCEHNSARSQMAEAYLKHFGKGKFEADSCGLEAGNLNPDVIQVMKEEGIDISNNTTDSVMSYFKEERQFDIVVTVCSPEVDSKCPLFPGKTLRMNWPFPDPAQLEGEQKVVMEELRQIRDQIKNRVREFIAEYEQKRLNLFVDQSSR